MEQFRDTVDLSQILLPLLLGTGACFYCADQDVFRRVAQIHKLQKLGAVAHGGQQICADGICC